jgi:molybdopterin-dependent oxidoreductase alpha subunit
VSDRRRLGGRIRRDQWVGLSPNGLGQQKPNHYGEMITTAVKNRRNLPYAWKVLAKGVCDGCALGVAGFHDWTLDGIHLCTTRLKLLAVNTADPMDHGLLSNVSALRGRSSSDLRDLGRLAHPMRRRRGDDGFHRITWDEALAATADAIRATTPDRVALYLTSRGITNETYYVAGKAARAMGVASIDSAARVCHAPSTLGMKAALGVSASTCSLQDVLETDLVVLWGANVANNQPVFTKYLYLAKSRGAKVVVINPYLEPGLERYWVPSNVESALFGTKLCDLHIPVRPGGDVAFANLVMRRLIERNLIDERFVTEHTTGFDELRRSVMSMDPTTLHGQCGLSAEQVEGFVDLYGRASGSVLIWSMGITQHRTGVEGVRAIMNVGLARGNVGRDGAGLMPIRGHSGVQGGAEMGAYATAFPGSVAVTAESAVALAEAWGFDVPPVPGLTAPEQIDAALDGALDVLFVDGGNFLEVLPDPPQVARALERVPLRVHQDIVVTSQMLVDGDDVILLPACTRYEQEGGGTETTTERRVAFSPEIPRRVGEARSEWRIFADLATRVRPDLSQHFAWPTNQALRTEIAQVVPSYAGIETLTKTGDAIQWGGRHLCGGGAFPTDDGRARFIALDVAPPAIPDGMWLVSTRRGKQFNSMVFDAVDPLTGAGRDAIYMDADDAATLGMREGDRVVLTSPTGTMRGTAKLVRLPSRTLQVHWPEGNVLIPAHPDHREPGSKVPDYNALVTVTKG